VHPGILEKKRRRCNSNWRPIGMVFLLAGSDDRYWRASGLKELEGDREKRVG